MDVYSKDDLARNIPLGSNFRVEYGAYKNFYYHNNTGNCKMCSIDNVKNKALQEDFIDTLKLLFLSVRKLAFKVDVTNKDYVDNLAKHFKLLYCNAVPIGYGNKYQYHACFLTNYERYDSRRNYIKRIEKEGVKTTKDMSKVLEKAKKYKSKAWMLKYLEKELK